MEILLGIIIEVLVLIITLWLIHFFFTLIHELGHGLAYQMVTSDNHWFMTINRGRKLFESKKLRVYLTPAIGYCYWDPQRLKTKKQFVITLAAGPFATLLVIIVLLCLWPYLKVENTYFLSSSFVEFLKYFILLYNLGLLFNSAWPYKGELFGEDYVSDGYQIKERLGKG